MTTSPTPLVRRIGGSRARVDWYSLVLFTAGTGASLAANLAHALPEPDGRFVAAVPPVAAALAFGGLMRWLHRIATLGPTSHLTRVGMWLLAAVTLIATGVGLWLSYDALYDYALDHGLSGLPARVWPLAIDTFVLTGEFGMFLSATVRSTEPDQTISDTPPDCRTAQTRPADLLDTAGDTMVANQTAVVHTEPDHAAEPAGEPDQTRPRTRRHHERDDDARTIYAASIQAGAPLSERALANRYGRGRTWARRIIAEVGDRTL